MNPKESIMAIIMALIVVGCGITCVAVLPSSGQPHTSDEIVILSADGSIESAETLIKQYGNGMLVEVTVDQISNSKAVLLDQSWIDRNGIAKTNQVVADQLAKGVIVAGTDISTFTNKSSQLPLMGFSEDADIYAMYYDKGNDRFVCCSIDAGSSELSMQKFKDWVISSNVSVTTKPSVTPATGSDYAKWGTELLTACYKYYNGYGWQNINTSYFPLVEDNANSNYYYYTKYDVQSVPDKGSQTCGINVYSKLSDSHRILDYGPTTTTGSTTVGVSLGVNSEGVVSAGVSWSYTVSDVIVRDSTNYGTNEFCIRHDLNKDSMVSSNTYTVKPGKVVQVSCNGSNKTGDYDAIDCYEVVFGKDVKSGPLGLQTKFEKKSFNIEMRVVVKSNQHAPTILSDEADASKHEDGGYDFEHTMPIIKRVSDVGKITPDDTGLIRTGYGYAGHSTNKADIVAQHAIGEVQAFRSNTMLDPMWVRS